MRDAPVPAAAAPPGQGAITLAPCPPARLDRLAALRQLRERHRFMKGLFGWIGFEQHPLTLWRALGGVLMIGGIALVALF